MLSIRESQTNAMASAAPGKRIIQPCKDATWIEILLVDEEGNPVSGARYRIRLPDGSLMEGTLNETGMTRFENLVPGDATISFPDIDRKEWRFKESVQP